jgi:hypothetical protein
MIKSQLLELFERDLTNLKKEIESYKQESNLWVTSGEIKNTPGNLTLHIVGNLKHFFGAVLSGTGYVRNREAEFLITDIPRKDILREIDEAHFIVKNTIYALPEEDFIKEYPEHVFEKPMSMAAFFVRLISHLNYHLGQINYHRRLLDK